MTTRRRKFTWLYRLGRLLTKRMTISSTSTYGDGCILLLLWLYFSYRIDLVVFSSFDEDISYDATAAQKSTEYCRRRCTILFSFVNEYRDMKVMLLFSVPLLPRR